jgi:hypothetical protein
MEIEIERGTYEVQTRKNGKYQTRVRSTNLTYANAYYNGINIGNGHTKRFLVNGKTIHKVKGY